MTATPTTAPVDPDATNLPPGASHPDVEHSDRPMQTTYLKESALALRKAWGAYLLMGFVPPLAMIGCVFYLIIGAPGAGVFGPSVVFESRTAGWWWLVGGMIFLSVTVPISFFVRRVYWVNYYRGEVVGPANYLKGNFAIWLPLVAAGVLGFVGLALTHYVASLFTSVMAFMIFLTMFPNGHAMTRPVGDHDDPAVYEEPK